MMTIPLVLVIQHFGSYALKTNSTGSSNVAIGYKALEDYTGNNTVAVGYAALANATGASKYCIRTPNIRNLYNWSK